jgi:peroxiredoxin
MKDFKGEYILLHFWNTWCPPCKNNLIRLDKAYEGLSKYMKVFAVVRGEKPEAIRNFLAENKISIPAFLDVDGRLSKSFNIKYIPSDRLINREGKVIVQNTGGLDWAQVLANIERDGGIREDKTTN